MHPNKKSSAFEDAKDQLFVKLVKAFPRYAKSDQNVIENSVQRLNSGEWKCGGRISSSSTSDKGSTKKTHCNSECLKNITAEEVSKSRLKVSGVFNENCNLARNKEPIAFAHKMVQNGANPGECFLLPLSGKEVCRRAFAFVSGLTSGAVYCNKTGQMMLPDARSLERSIQSAKNGQTARSRRDLVVSGRKSVTDMSSEHKATHVKVNNLLLMFAFNFRFIL